jgi:hypothetical protein
LPFPFYTYVKTAAKIEVPIVSLVIFVMMLAVGEGIEEVEDF